MSRLDELIAAERDSMVPDASTRAANLAGLRRGLAEARPPLVEAPPPGAAIGAGGIGWLEVTIASVLIIGALVWWLSPREDEAPDRGTTAALAQPARTPGPPSAEAAPLSEPAPTRARAASPVVVPPEPPEPIPDEAAPPVAEKSAAARPSHPRAKAPTDDFAAELALLKRAKAAHVAGDRKRALALLRDQGRRFRPGAFAEERRALEAILLCELGRRERGREAAADFYRDFAASPQTERVRHACE